MEDRVVIVMGSVATGKTTFINQATQRGDIGVSHRLKRGTTDVQRINFRDPFENLNLVFLDTPGFDSYEESDEKIVAMIREFLLANKLKVDTIIYLRSIAENRVIGLNNLRMLGDIWRGDVARHLIIVTTMWDEVREATGSARERELIHYIRQESITNGCRFERFDHTSKSAWRIIHSSLRKPVAPPLDVNKAGVRSKQGEKRNTLLYRLLQIFRQLFLKRI